MSPHLLPLAHKEGIQWHATDMHYWPMRFGGEERSPLLVIAPAHMAEGILPSLSVMNVTPSHRSRLTPGSYLHTMPCSVNPSPFPFVRVWILQTLRSSVLGTSTRHWSGHYAPVRVYARGVVLSARQREWKGDAYCICR